MTVKVRTIFQPRHLIEVPDQEAEVMAAQGLLWEGRDEDLAQLLATDPFGPLDPRPQPPAPQDKAPDAPADKASAKPAPAAADKPPAADTAKGA